MDISNYTIEQLKEALSSINEEKFPERTELLKVTVEGKLEDGYSRLVAMNEDGDGSYIPLSFVFPIWIHYTALQAILLIAVSIGLNFVLGIGFSVIKVPAYFALPLVIIVQITVFTVISLFVIRKTLSRNYKKFDIVFLPKN